MDVNVCKTKFKLLFDKILKSNFELSDYHSENLIKILEGSRNTRIGKILETPFFANLIIHALNNFGATSDSVKVFIIKLMRIVLRNEVDFNRFHQMQGFELLVARIREGNCSSALHSALVRVLFAHVSHYSGVRFIMENKAYKQVLRPYTPTQAAKGGLVAVLEPLFFGLITGYVPPEVARDIYDFMAKLVWKLNEYDEETALLEALQFIVQPIADCEYYDTENINLEAEKVISDMFVPNIYTLIAIVDEVENVVEPNNVVPLLARFLQVEAKLMLMLQRTADAELAGLLAEACLRLRFATSRSADCAAPPDRGADVYVTEDLSLTFNKLLCTLINKKSVAVVLDFACRCHIFWHKVEAVTPPVSFERFGRQYQMRNQFLTIILVPIFVRQKAEEKLVADHELQEAIQDFSISLSEIVSIDVVKAAYRMRDLIMQESGSTVAACVCSVRVLARLRGQLSRRQAGIVFQALYYALSEYVLTDGAGMLVLGANPLRTPEDVSLVAATLDAIDMLLQEHDITWYESSEITNLQAALINLIKQNILPTELLVRVVALATVSARKLLSPELALQLPSARGGSLQETGAIAAALLVHAACAVRVIALKLLQTLTEIAYVKFVSLRKVILEHRLMAAAHAVLTDPEAGARAAALRCLASATRCECIWKELLSQYDNFYEQLVNMLQHDPEGEVRKEAAHVLTHVYINHKVTRTFTVCVSKVMATAAIHDPHWEVKLAALDYWKQFAKSHFTDLGVIDGRFPPVTFCKKKRKIITLTDKEIRNNIESALDYLSSVGGLTVLLRCMNSCNHLEVIEKAYRFTSHFVESIDKLIPEEPSISQIPMLGHDKNVEMTSIPLIPEAIDKDNSNHVDLISEILESLGSDPAVEDPIDTVEIISPKEFLATYRATDYKAIIESKNKTSVDDLGTLIDEMISPEYQLSLMMPDS